MHIGRPRRFETVEAFVEAWEAYKDACDHREVRVYDFSAKNSEFVSAVMQKYTTYTIEGFCVFAKLSRAQFYKTYEEDPAFADIVTRIREECEVDARQKFELGAIPPQLAPLWMGHYGYSTRADAHIGGSVPVVISGGDELED